jgi:ATP-dependent DNA helicase RecQ
MTPQEALKKYWGHDAFRPLQEEIINSILVGKDALAILPTGGGKSICFQVPAMLKEGCCLVVSPLIALMEDQVQHLQHMNITAKAIMSGMSVHETLSTLEACSNDEIKFLYVSPERLETRMFLDRLVHLPISLIAVDEAHCISQWGYDFRPSYLNIAKIRAHFPRVPVIALTASATSLVKEDILDKLKMKSASTFMTSFVRPNLVYTSEVCYDKINRMLGIIKKVPGCTIIYCKTRRKTKELSDILTQHNLSSDFYHAGLEQEIRKDKQQSWLKGETRIMVCTNAFGMGIDKPDVRLVMHADIPDCVENYYQEAGRAGRDGNKAFAVLLFNEQELEDLKKMPDVKFPSIQTIRSVYQSLANYFQIPNGLGADQYFDFDMDDFMQKFKNPLNEILYSLQALKQERIISYLEQVYRPAFVQFICNKDDLIEFEKNNPTSEPVVKALLRTYSGIFDIMVRINEKQIAKIIRKDLGFVIRHLQFIAQNGIIKYIPKKESPQIYYLQNRIKTEELNLNYDNYLKRKKQYTQRISEMINYATGNECKSSFIGKYFGDFEIEACGKCDCCLKKKKEMLTKEAFKLAYDAIITILKNEKMTIDSLTMTTNIKKEILMEVILEMKHENKIGIDINNNFFLK